MPFKLIADNGPKHRAIYKLTIHLKYNILPMKGIINLGFRKGTEYFKVNYLSTALSSAFFYLKRPVYRFSYELKNKVPTSVFCGSSGYILDYEVLESATGY